MDDGVLDRLLGYHGRRYWLANGWSLRFRVWRVAVTSSRPRGLRYAFTLHDVDATRLLGFDNAHGVLRGGVAHDHCHRFRRTRELAQYTFSDADTLLVDFFEAVRRACEAEGVSFLIDAEDMMEEDDDGEDNSGP